MSLQALRDDFFGRYRKGLSLCTINVRGEERVALREALSQAIAQDGIMALTEEPGVGCFVLYAAEFLSEEGSSLAWRPILASVGVAPDDAARYPELYDPIERFLEAHSKAPIRRHGRRRFLATLLREGGLPSKIGNLPELLGPIVREVGWDALTGLDGMAARRFVVARLQATADGTLRLLLEHVEAAEALEELLADAADTRQSLYRRGVDPTKLSTGDAVRAALEAHGIELPATRNEQLLAKLLATFRERTREARGDTASPFILPIVDLVAREQADGRLALLLRLHLKSSLLRTRIPGAVSYVAVNLEPGMLGGQLVSWSEESACFESDNGVASLEWEHDVSSGPVTVTARYLSEQGTAEVAVLDTVEGSADVLQLFDAEGKRLSEQRETLRHGECLLLVAREPVHIRSTGDVRVEPRRAPLGAKAAWVIEAVGEGTVEIKQGDEPLAWLESSTRTLAVRVEGGKPASLSTSTRYVERLPDLVVQDAPQGVDIECSIGPREDYRVVQRGVLGRISLASMQQLRGVCGTVRIRLRSADGRRWNARWVLVSPSLIERVEVGAIHLASANIAHVGGPHVAASQEGPRSWRACIAAEVELARLDVMMQSGDVLRLAVPMPRAHVRLWQNLDAQVEAPLDGSAIITEKMAFCGACVEVRNEPERRVTLEDPSGACIVGGWTDRHGRAFLSLTEVVRYQTAVNKPSIRVIARVDGDRHTYQLRVVVPRLERPRPVMKPEGLVLRLDLDADDLPEKPCLLWFDIVRLAMAPIVAECALRQVEPHAYEAFLPTSKLPTVRGGWVVFLADGMASPPRPMSGGVLVGIPLGQLPPPPSGLTPLQEALWVKDERKVVDDLESLASDKLKLRIWLEQLVAAVRQRASFGLHWFFLLEVIARRAPWVILAAAVALTPRERYEWLDLWRVGFQSFDWLGFLRSSRRPLARALHAVSVHQIVALIMAAKQVRRMHGVVELAIYKEIATERPDLAPLVLSVESELLEFQEALSWPKDWSGLELPMHDLSEATRENTLRGKRAAALLPLKQGASQAVVDELSTPWGSEIGPMARRLVQSVRSKIADEARRKHVPLESHSRKVVDLEQNVAAAAAVLTVYWEHGEWPRKEVWSAIRAIDARIPDLLNVWLLALMNAQEIQ